MRFRVTVRKLNMTDGWTDGGGGGGALQYINPRPPALREIKITAYIAVEISNYQYNVYDGV